VKSEFLISSLTIGWRLGAGRSGERALQKTIERGGAGSCGAETERGA